MKLLTGSLFLLALTAGTANAVEVTVTGAVNIPTFGSVGPLGINSTMQNDILLTQSGNASLVGVARAANTSSGNQQILSLTLTAFTFTANAAGTYNLSVTITQDYALEPTAMSATGSHQLNGNIDFSAAGQQATVTSTSVHESTNLPFLTTGAVNSAGPGVVGIDVGQGPTTPITLIGDVYRITNTYTFQIVLAAAGTVAIDLPDSGVDNAAITLIPLPPAGLAGLGGLAFVGAGAILRRRSLHKA